MKLADKRLQRRRFLQIRLRDEEQVRIWLSAKRSGQRPATWARERLLDLAQTVLAPAEAKRFAATLARSLAAMAKPESARDA